MVIDPVGGRHSEAALRATRLFGRFCVIGFAAGSIASIPLNLVLLQNRTLIGVEWGGWAVHDPGGNRDLFADLLVMIEDGRLHPTRPASYAAHRGAFGAGRSHRAGHRRQGRARTLTEVVQPIPCGRATPAWL